MTCDVHRGDSNQPVWHMNNWLSNERGTSDWTRAHIVNDYDFLLNRSLECWELHGLNQPLSQSIGGLMEMP